MSGRSALKKARGPLIHRSSLRYAIHRYGSAHARGLYSAAPQELLGASTNVVSVDLGSDLVGW